MLVKLRPGCEAEQFDPSASIPGNARRRDPPFAHAFFFTSAGIDYCLSPGDWIVTLPGECQMVIDQDIFHDIFIEVEQ